jgi:hypothetical protein
MMGYATTGVYTLTIPEGGDLDHYWRLANDVVDLRGGVAFAWSMSHLIGVGDQITIEYYDTP